MLLWLVVLKEIAKKCSDKAVIGSKVFRASTRISEHYSGSKNQNKDLSNCNNADICNTENF